MRSLQNVVEGFTEFFEKGLEKLIEESFQLSPKKKLPYAVRIYPADKTLRWVKYGEAGYVFNPSSGELVGTCPSSTGLYRPANISDKCRFANIVKEYYVL